MPRVKCTQVMSLFRFVMRNFTLRRQLRHHQVLVHSQARHEFFAVRVYSVCALAHMSLNRAVPYVLVDK